MDDRQKEIIEKLGLEEKDFEPSDFTDEDRLNMLEEAIVELAEVIG